MGTDKDGNELTLMDLLFEKEDCVFDKVEKSVQKEKLIRILFPSPQDVLHHLKQTGVTGTQKQTWTRSRLQAFCDSYIQHFAQTDGQVSLTFHPVFFIATKI